MDHLFGWFAIMMANYIRPKWIGYVIIASVILLALLGFYPMNDDDDWIGH
ncbi:hypothetical protein [Brevibacillus brevis]|uniref:Uncharacterized protein n=1 Tax=Brevibacillus brevis TaxID=1393 RepID=A0ABY9T911_BREBE|nr:hypothetical protein [Brevibacillus brevis]WNC16598.1 hypothetical protein RGB73_09855 [Brevibacillus brevis]